MTPGRVPLVIAGGAGPVHACDIARELDLQLLIVPKASSVFCATGMLLSNLRHDYVRVHYSNMDEEDVNTDTVNSLLEEMKEEGFATLRKEGIPQEKMEFTCTADLKYVAQFNEIEILLPLNNGRFSFNDLPDLQCAFDNKHDALYGYSLPCTPLELICLRVKAEGITEKLEFKKLPFVGEDASAAIKAQREIYYEEEMLTVPVYDGNRMQHGNRLPGPAIIEEPTTTLFITPDFQVTCDRYCNYIIYPKGLSLDETITQIGK
ncbi:hydantoinase/oxoprolinase family protein [Chloroflexota bacterium]